MKHFNIKHINDKMTFKPTWVESIIDGSKKVLRHGSKCIPISLLFVIGVWNSNCQRNAHGNQSKSQHDY